MLDCNGVGAIEDRYVFQPAILRAFGWRVIDIPAHSWLRDPGAVIAQIEAVLRRDSVEEDDDPFEGAPMPSVSAPKPGEPTSLEPEPQPSVASFSEFRFRQGSSDKFWEIAVSGVEMVVIFGRIGTKGSTVTKTFETAKRAKRESAKLIAEKIRKGYLEL